MEIYGRLLGAPRVRVSEAWYDLPQTKASALLLYLAYSGEWLSREELLYIFYPDTPEAPARTSFRQLLTAVRKFPYSQGLESQDTRLRWQIETNVAAFKQALLQEKWPKALELYQGEFLHGFQPYDLREFDNWLALERQTLHAMWRKAGLTFAGELAITERSSLAAEVLASVYKADVLDEEVLRVYLESLYGSGQKGQALETFTTFKNTLRHELSSEPEASTLELMTLIQNDKPLGATGSVTVKTRVQEIKSHHNLPVQPTEFVGRETEKAKLAHLLTDPSCRLLTIVASGGMGKTRLALEVAKAQLENFAGVCFVSFAAVASPEVIVYTLADALKLSLFGSKPPKEQVLDYLKNKRMLLVLDNLEHLLSSIDLISDILVASSEIKILATSRERLGLQSEHLFDLFGLSVSDVNGSDAHSSDALQLFAERAKHNRLDFVLEQHLQAVTRICQLVGGMPLAIELAASWSRLLSPEEIAKELEQNLDILATSTRDLPERHHNMRSVFEVSWQRLSAEEKTALRKLSVFQGGFTREAARAIAEIDLPILLSLVNKSFVWRDTLGRFSQHPLLLQYLQHKANDYPDEKKHIEEKPGLYYLELVKELVLYLQTQKHRETQEILDKEQANIRAAWDWMLREKRVEDIRRYARAFYALFIDRPYEGENLFRQAVAVLDENNPDHHAALGYAIIYQLRYEAGRTGSIDPFFAEKIKRGLALLEPHKEYPGILMAHEALAAFVWGHGDFARVKGHLLIELELARKYGNHVELSWCLSGLMLLEREMGFSFSEVSALMRDYLIELRELGNLSSLGFALCVFGAYLVYNDTLEEGEKLLRESLNMLRTTDTEASAPCADLARSAYKRRDFDGAERYAREAYGEAVKTHYEFMKATALAIWGRVKLAQGHVQEAERLMLESLRLGHSENLPIALSHSLLVLAELSVVKGNVKQGVCWLSFLKHYQAIEKRDRDEAIKILEQAKEQLSARAFSQAQKESKALTLETIVTGILERTHTL
jgi:DNA-binding SARP family transcriptional activator